MTVVGVSPDIIQNDSESCGEGPHHIPSQTVQDPMAAGAAIIGPARRVAPNSLVGRVSRKGSAGKADEDLSAVRGEDDAGTF